MAMATSTPVSTSLAAPKTRFPTAGAFTSGSTVRHALLQSVAALSNLSVERGNSMPLVQHRDVRNLSMHPSARAVQHSNHPVTQPAIASDPAPAAGSFAHRKLKCVRCGLGLWSTLYPACFSGLLIGALQGRCMRETLRMATETGSVFTHFLQATGASWAHSVPAGALSC